MKTSTIVFVVLGIGVAVGALWYFMAGPGAEGAAEVIKRALPADPAAAADAPSGAEV